MYFANEEIFMRIRIILSKENRNGQFFTQVLMKMQRPMMLDWKPLIHANDKLGPSLYQNGKIL